MSLLYFLKVQIGTFPTVLLYRTYNLLVAYVVSTHKKYFLLARFSEAARD